MLAFVLLGQGILSFLPAGTAYAVWGNAEKGGPSQPPSGPVSIWGGRVRPSLTNLNDGQPIEFGVKFRSSIAGYITGLRFYKGTLDTGTHVGSLWTARGRSSPPPRSAARRRQAGSR